MLKVSVIIPCYNSERFLPDTIESLLRQDLPDWECILVDDGSTDTTFQTASDLIAGDPRMRIIRQQNGGRALALMAGYAKASPQAPYVFFLDSDDLLEPGALRILSAYLDENSEVAVAGCWSQLIDKDGNEIVGQARSRWVPGRFLPRRLERHEVETPFTAFYCCTGQGPFAMHRRSAFDKTTGLDPRFSEFSLHEDTDLFCQMALQGEVHYLPDQLYRTRIHGHNVSKGNNRVQLAHARFREKWDNYSAADAEQQAKVTAARRFYFGTFGPCRDLKVASEAFGQFFTKGDVNAARWGMHLISNALRHAAVVRFDRR